MGGMNIRYKDIGEGWKFSEEFVLHTGENVTWYIKGESVTTTVICIDVKNSECT